MGVHLPRSRAFQSVAEPMKGDVQMAKGAPAVGMIGEDGSYIGRSMQFVHTDTSVMPGCHAHFFDNGSS